MAVVVRRATLGSYIKDVLLTPIAWFAILPWLLKWKIFWLLIIVAILIALKGPQLLPMPSPRDLGVALIAIVLTPIFLMTVAIFMTVFDHMRFGGWTDVGQGAEVLIATQFAKAIIAGDTRAAAQLSIRELRRDESAFSEFVQSLRRELGNVTRPVTSADLQTIDHVIFRQLVPMLREIEIGPEDVLAFVPTISSPNIPVGTPIKTLQLVIGSEHGEQYVAGTRVVSILRPEILTMV